MRINKFIALSSGLSRRASDAAVVQGRVSINGHIAQTGSSVPDDATVTLDGILVRPPTATQTILLNKPVGYVVSRAGQGARTIYDLLPTRLHQLKPVGRLDKDSSGLLLMTNDGALAHQLTHPRFQKVKIYEIQLDKPLQPLHRQMINDMGIQLEDGPSKLTLVRLHEANDQAWQITMTEGRNRQIRRTFAALGYTVTKLHRTQFGPYQLASIPKATWVAL